LAAAGCTSGVPGQAAGRAFVWGQDAPVVVTISYSGEKPGVCEVSPPMADLDNPEDHKTKGRHLQGLWLVDRSGLEGSEVTISVKDTKPQGGTTDPVAKKQLDPSYVIPADADAIYTGRMKHGGEIKGHEGLYWWYSVEAKKNGAT